MTSWSLIDLLNDNNRPKHQNMLDQLLSLGITPEDYLAIASLPSPHTCRPSMLPDDGHRETAATKQDRRFQVCLDVHHFAFEEISAKTAGGYLVVEASHEERLDEYGLISRSFTRRYQLPEGVDPDMVSSRLSSDGVLVVYAPIKPPPDLQKERAVPIVKTGPVRKHQGKQ